MAAAAKPITGAQVRWAMIAFFAVIIGLDTLFITFAIRSHPGEQVRNSYVLGLDYNSQLARQEAQRALGWSARAGLDARGETFVVALQDADGEPVRGLHVSVQMHVTGARQAEASFDLIEGHAGDYSAAVPLDGPGRALMAITVRRAANSPVVFEATKTLGLS